MEPIALIPGIFVIYLSGICSGAVIQVETTNYGPCHQLENNPLRLHFGTEARCKKNGNFKPLQTFNMKLECYFPMGVDYVQRYPGNGPCRMLKQCLRQKHHEFGGLKEHKWIRCDKYGYFKPLQKQEKGNRICVDFYGNIRKRNKVTNRADCIKSIIAHRRR
ncbi:uncharacterized protein LOC124434565 [Xenia sp. Carnegie-2017]|uniref:uncharacterized protein LOC124434565 n=1 Tax=Xenia sp. Carnegie-2017 TaxID=2897299 RepID=UPI001F04F638|nr:uncharacterized protein LOC124434565 [Xenia sp. Carnegie-2017]